MTMQERTLRFECQGDTLYGIASVPATPHRRGVVIVVGGPQTRVGSHRQFTLLARYLAQRGTPVLRFDYRGMGDSEGEQRGFERVDDDLRAAIDAFCAAVPALEEVVLWGLCDAASAALFYAASDARVRGLVLANPWVRTEEGAARATLKHYYLQRLRDPSFWKKVATLRFNYGAAFGSFARLLRAARPAPAAAAAVAASVPDSQAPAPAPAPLPLRARMLAGIKGFEGRLLLMISGADLTAQEFLDMEKASPEWKGLLARPQVQRWTLPEADHTFSQRAWSDQAAARTADWLAALDR